MKKKNFLKKKTNERYSTRYKNSKNKIKALGWGSLEDQHYRFKQILNLLPKNLESLIDIGCGFGDFYEFVSKSKSKINKYIGWDINEDFIKYAKKKYKSEKNAKFYTKDILDIKSQKPVAKHAILIGTLNFNWKSSYDNLELNKSFIKKAFSIIDESLIVDFLSIYRFKRYPAEDGVFYNDPSRILKFCLSITNNVQLIHDYDPIPQKEFMVLLKKNKY